MKRTNLNRYESPVMELMNFKLEGVICASVGLWGSSNEALNGEEQLTDDVTFGW